MVAFSPEERKFVKYVDFSGIYGISINITVPEAWDRLVAGGFIRIFWEVIFLAFKDCFFEVFASKEHGISSKEPDRSGHKTLREKREDK
ncbi:MAG: hypothetical protein ACI9E1_000561 [Cryomorphaceae bacterium]